MCPSGNVFFALRCAVAADDADAVLAFDTILVAEAGAEAFVTFAVRILVAEAGAEADAAELCCASAGVDSR